MTHKKTYSQLRLERRIGYCFKNNAFLKQALTHCSSSKVNNERYEFLGDSILNFIIAQALFAQFPNLSEGELSRLRSYLVKGETLAKVAAELQLGTYLFLGQGELKTGGHRRESILADALEALIAAVLLDGGVEASKDLVLKLYDSKLKDVLDYLDVKDAKTQLQEYLQAHKKALPEYCLVRIEGLEHKQTFYVACKIPGVEKTIIGSGSNRRKAEQAAAQLSLEEFEKEAL